MNNNSGCFGFVVFATLIGSLAAYYYLDALTGIFVLDYPPIGWGHQGHCGKNNLSGKAEL